MKQRTTHIWFWLCVLLLCFLSSGALLAQDEPAEQPPAPDPLLFEGILNDGNDTQGNNVVFTVAVNAGDQITATALCEMADDGLRRIDPALTVYAPQGEDSLERLQWYNDDSDAVTDCVDYRSSQIRFEAPFTGEYEFVIENLAGRSGPFTLEILGSTAIQTQLDIAPPAEGEDTFVESGAEEQPGLAALDVSDGEGEATNIADQELSFAGLLSAKDDIARAQRRFEININAADEVVAELTCEEAFGGRWLDPSLTISFTNEAGEVSSWENDDHDAATECLAYRSARIEFTAPESGVYTVVAENLSFYKGSYLLRISGVTAPQLTTVEAAPLWDGTGDPPGSLTAFEGNLEVKGEGTHIVQLEEGERVAALAICEAVDGLRPMDPVLRVLDPAGALVLHIDDSLGYQSCASWYSAYAEFTATTAGEYTFIVRNVAKETSGPYTLAVVRSELSAVAAAVQRGGGGGGGESSVAKSGDSHVGSLGEIGSVFLVDTDKGPRLDVYAIDSSSVGQHVLSIYGDQLGSAPGGELLLASARGGSYSAFYRPDGSLRLSAGPNSEGKLFHLILSGIPGTVLSTYNDLVQATASAAAASGDTASSPPNNILTTHIVQPGETLYSIGVRYGVGYEAIAAANGIGSDYIIHVGAELAIPAP